jgi:hypothetical protein
VDDGSEAEEVARLAGFPAAPYYLQTMRSPVSLLILILAAETVVAQTPPRALTAEDSAAIVWRAACGPGRPMSSDSAVMLGRVRDATRQAPVAGALVEIVWSDLSVSDKKQLRQKNYRLEAVADQNGDYAACGVPTEAVLHVHAVAGVRQSGLVDLTIGDRLLYRFDVAVGEAQAQTFGTVAGLVAGAGGRPIANARITIGDAPEVRTGNDGQFIVRQVPVGTRQIEAAAIGMEPVTEVVEVKTNDTVHVTFDIQKISALDTVRVRGLSRQQLLPREINERRRLGFGHFVDSARLEKTGMTLKAAIGEVPGAYIRLLDRSSAMSRFVVMLPSGTGRCTANVLVDRIQIPPESIDLYRTNDIAVIEVYARSAEVPLDLVTKNRECGVVAIWTKNALR